MIIRKKEHWFRMLFVWKGSVISQLLPRLGLLFLLSTGVVWFQPQLIHYGMHLNPAPFTLFGIALALFLGFRNNASYDRWWEGRKLLGQVLNSTRNLTRQIHTLIDNEPGDPASHPNRRFPIDCLIAFTYTLKHQLRKTDATADIDRLLPPDTAARIKAARYQPTVLLKEIGTWIQSVQKRGLTDSPRIMAMEASLTTLMDTVGGSERISSTPIPYSYSVLLHRTVYVYCFLLPLGLVESLGWMTPIIVAFVAYTYVALEAIADELEDPYGTLPNDLALDSMCRMTENSLLELDDRPALPDIQPTDNFYLT